MNALPVRGNRMKYMDGWTYNNGFSHFCVEFCHTKIIYFLQLGLDFKRSLYYNEHCKYIQRKAENNEDL